MDKTELLKEVFRTCTFDEILDYGLDKLHISSNDIINAAAEYDVPVDETMNDKDRLLSKVEDELDIMCERARQLNKVITLELPDVDDFMSLLLQYYDASEILDCMSKDELLDHLEDSYELGQHDEEVIANFEKEHDIDDEDDVVPFTQDNIVRFVRDYPHYKFRPFLCDIAGLGHYCTDEELFDVIKEKTKFK